MIGFDADVAKTDLVVLCGESVDLKASCHDFVFLEKPGNHQVSISVPVG